MAAVRSCRHNKHGVVDVRDKCVEVILWTHVCEFAPDYQLLPTHPQNVAVANPTPLEPEPGRLSRTTGTASALV